MSMVNINVRLPARLVKRLDRLAKTLTRRDASGYTYTRSDVLRHFVATGIDELAPTMTTRGRGER